MKDQHVFMVTINLYLPTQLYQILLLEKKSQSIAYHFVNEGVARHEWKTSYVNTNNNEAGLLTKQLPHGDKRKGFVSNLLHHIFGLSGSVMKK